MLVNSIGYQRMSYVNSQNKIKRNTNPNSNTQKVNSSIPFGLERFVVLRNLGGITEEVELAIKSFLKLNKNNPIEVLKTGEGFIMPADICIQLGSKLIKIDRRNRLMDPKVYERLVEEGFIKEQLPKLLNLGLPKEGLPPDPSKIVHENPVAAKLIEE